MAHITLKGEAHLACYALAAVYSVIMLASGPTSIPISNTPNRLLTNTDPLPDTNNTLREKDSNDIPIEDIDPNSSNALDLLEKKVEAL